MYSSIFLPITDGNTKNVRHTSSPIPPSNQPYLLRPSSIPRSPFPRLTRAAMCLLPRSISSVSAHSCRCATYMIMALCLVTPSMGCVCWTDSILWWLCARLLILSGMALVVLLGGERCCRISGSFFLQNMYSDLVHLAKMGSRSLHTTSLLVGMACRVVSKCRMCMWWCASTAYILLD